MRREQQPLPVAAEGAKELVRRTCALDALRVRDLTSSRRRPIEGRIERVDADPEGLGESRSPVFAACNRAAEAQERAVSVERCSRESNEDVDDWIGRLALMDDSGLPSSLDDAPPATSERCAYCACWCA